MKLTVLADNYTYIDRYYFGEPALSFYIEDGTERILFDTGYSDVFIKNAEKLGVDLSRLTMIVFSHGHNDHTGGLPYLWNAQDLSGVSCLRIRMCLRTGNTKDFPLARRSPEKKCSCMV